MGKLGYWEWNCLTNEVYWSRQKKMIFGVSADFATSMDSVFGLVHEDDRDFIMETIARKMPLGKPFEYTYRGLHATGKILTIWVKATVIQDAQGKIMGISGVSQDISERVQYEQVLKELSQLKNSVLSTLSHGLRNPLGGIQTLCELIRHNRGNEISLIEKISEIEDACREAMSMVEEMAGSANLDPGMGLLTSENINLTGYLNTTIRANRYLAVSRHITVITRFPEKAVYVKINSQKLLQSLGKLLIGAIQSANEHSTICVELTEMSQLVRIGIRDLGKANNEEANEDTLLPQGITRLIPENYRGKLWVELEKNSGANFFVEMVKS